MFPGQSDGQQRYQLGPSAVTGGVRTASARDAGHGGGWVVLFSFNDDASARFNELAAELFPKQPPQNSVAIVLDGVVQTAPAFQTSSFAGAVQISGNFTRTEAETIVAILRTGSYPVAVHLVG